MDRAAAELFLASLFLESTPERGEALRNAAKAARSWEGLPGALEAHGVLPLFLRNLSQAGVELPPAIAPVLEARAGAQREQDQRARLGLTRFLAAAAREGVELTLVGGTALAYDLYPEMLRRLGALELLTAPEHLARALRAATEAGLLLSEAALPAWWYRRTDTRLPLAPSSPMLAPVSLACRLHHPSLLLTAREPEVLARRRRFAHEGHALFLLDPLDALLELTTSISTRAGESLVSGRRHLLEAAAGAPRALALDQILDLRAFVERRHGELAPAAVLARAREWGAGPALRAGLECIQMGLGFLPGAREWARAVAHGLASPARVADAPASALFRPDPFERLPQWLRPSDAYLCARYALPPTPAVRALRLARARHLASILGAGAVAGIGFPLALAARRLARRARRAAWDHAQTPQRLSDVSSAWKAAARAEQQKPITPRTIALPEREEGVARFPDHYKG